MRDKSKQSLLTCVSVNLFLRKGVLIPFLSFTYTPRCFKDKKKQSFTVINAKVGLEEKESKTSK